MRCQKQQHQIAMRGTISCQIEKRARRSLLWLFIPQLPELPDSLQLTVNELTDAMVRQKFLIFKLVDKLM